MRKLLSIILVFTMLLMVFPIVASAEEYSNEFPILPDPVMPVEEYDSEYPNVYNSGSTLWIHCQIANLGDYVIVLDPTTPLDVFGFDAPTGYNLINNSSSTVSGRAYSLTSNTAYNARWTSFYKLQLQTGTSQYGQAAYEDYNVTKIYGTTMNLIDVHGDRGNDYYRGLPVENRVELIIHIAVACIEVLLVVLLIQRRRLF